MHEHDFQILEGRDITLPELGKEIENITGRTVTHSTGDIKRVVHTCQILNQKVIHL